MLDARQIPQAPEVERGLIGAFLDPANENMTCMMAPQLTRHDFVDPRNQIIHQGVLANLRARITPTPFTVADEIKRMGRMDQIGGIQTVLDIASDSQYLVDYQPYVDVLHSKRRLREIMHATKDAFSRAEAEGDDPVEIVTALQERLRSISAGASKHDVESGLDMLEELAHIGPLMGLQGVEGGSWGDPLLDEWCPIPRGEYVSFGGRPGLGKSTMMAQGMVASARRGLRVLGLTMEMNKAKLKARVSANITGIPFGRFLRGQYDEHAVAAIARDQDALGRIFYSDPTNGTPWAQIEALIRHQVEVNKIDTVFLDQFDKIGRGEVKQGSSEAYSYGRISEQIMALAKDLQIGFVLLVQLKNENEAEPTLGSHADSDRPGKDASVVVHIYRSGKKIKGKIQKNRDGGYVGHVFELDIDGACQRIRVVENTTDEKKKGL